MRLGEPSWPQPVIRVVPRTVMFSGRSIATSCYLARGVWANAKALEGWREELESVLGVGCRSAFPITLPIPDIDGRHVEVREVA